MSLSLGFFTFLNAWWIMLFFVLPFHIRKNDRDTDIAYAAAPATPPWRRIIIINTALSLAITAILAVIINSGVFTLGDTSVF
jgi:predicted secreted protein